MPLVRAGRRGGHNGRDGGDRLTSGLGDVADEFLRAGLEVAFAVALASARQQPPVAAPASLRPFLRFKKLPPAALGPVRRAVEADEEFRARVALVANDELVDRPAALWIHRPDGWERELLTLWDAHRAGEEAEAGERAERSAQKRLDAAERAARRAQAELAVVRGELDAERSARREADAARASTERRARQLEVELAGARRRLDAVGGDQHALRARVAELEEELGRALAEVARVAPEVSELPVDEGPAGTGGAETAAAGDSAAGSAERPAPAIEPDFEPRGALAAALGEAAEATQRLARALEAAQQSLGGAVAGPRDPEPSSTPTPSDSPPLRRIDIDSTKSVRADVRRRAVTLPVGMLSDSTEALLHLLHVPHVIVLVDGYNVTKLAWPAEALPEQRQRLVDLLVELTARHPAPVKVVFDGRDVTSARHHGGRHVRVAFSPFGVTADEVLVELVAGVAGERPVVVITSDRALGERVRALGANVVRSAQLLATAHRLPHDQPEA